MTDYSIILYLQVLSLSFGLFAVNIIDLKYKVHALQIMYIALESFIIY